MQIVPVDGNDAPATRSDILPFSALIDDQTPSGGVLVGALNLKAGLLCNEFGKTIAEKCLGITVYCQGSHPITAFLWEQHEKLSGLPLAAPVPMVARIVGDEHVANAFEVAINATPISLFKESIALLDELLAQLEKRQQQLSTEIKNVRTDMVISHLIGSSKELSRLTTTVAGLEVHRFELKQRAFLARTLLVKAQLRREERTEQLKDGARFVLPHAFKRA